MDSPIEQITIAEFSKRFDPPDPTGELKPLFIQATEAVGNDYPKMYALAEQGIVLARRTNNLPYVCRFLIKRAQAYRVQSKSEAAKEDLATIIALVSKLDVKEALYVRMQWANQTAFIYQDEGAIVEARQHFLLGIDLANQLGHVYMAGTINLNMYVLLMEYFGDFEGALTFIRTALRVMPKDNPDYPLILFNLGHLSYFLGDYVTAQYYLDEANAIDIRVESFKSLFHSLSCHLCIRDNKIEEAIQWAERAMQAARTKGTVETVLASAVSAASEIYFKTKQYELAIERLTELLDLSTVTYVCSAHAELAHTYAALALENRDNTSTLKAKEHLTKARSMLEHVPDVRRIHVLSVISETFSLLGNNDEAFAALKQSLALNERICSAKSKNELGSLRLLMKIEREEHEKEIAKLKALKFEQDLANSTMHLAMQTELLGTFRNELRQIVREIDEPIAALKKIKEKLKELPCEQIDWIKFETEFTNVHPEFKAKLIEAYPDLTKQQVKMCQLARLGLKTFEMARLLCLSERSIESHRYSLRKKLGIPTEQNLTQFLSAMK